MKLPGKVKEPDPKPTHGRLPLRGTSRTWESQSESRFVVVRAANEPGGFFWGTMLWNWMVAIVIQFCEYMKR